VSDEDASVTITLRPEQERAVADAIRSGAYQTPNEVIERALEVLRFEDGWLQENKQLIEEKIDRAIGQLDRGEGISAEELPGRLEKRKAAWRAEQSR